MRSSSVRETMAMACVASRLAQAPGISLACLPEPQAQEHSSSRDQHGARGGPPLAGSFLESRRARAVKRPPSHYPSTFSCANFSASHSTTSCNCSQTPSINSGDALRTAMPHGASARVVYTSPRQQLQQCGARSKPPQENAVGEFTTVCRCHLSRGCSCVYQANSHRSRFLEVRAHYPREYLELLSNRNAISSPLPEFARLAGEHMRTPSLSHCPAYIMLPLDTVTTVNTLNLPRALQAGLRALKSIGVDGVMVDVWWGIVEAAGPSQYDWSAYAALVRMVHAAGLKMQAVMSFHGCGGNVGDTCHVSLPGWVLQEAVNNPDILYTDRAGCRNNEYLSLGVDKLPLFAGRTPLEMYGDFISSFRETFADYMGTTIVEVSVGLGPAGELRYPSYPEGDGRWQYPGIGEFQCYDKYMLASLRACAEAVGRPDWGLSGPHDSGTYNQRPDETGFFDQGHGSWLTEYGDFFLSWYSQSLIAHGSRVLSVACQALMDSGVLVAAKLPGIHWWYRCKSHPAELTAGYYNTSMRCGYEPVVRMLARHNALLNFTCVEMGDDEQPWYTFSSPESLLMQVRECCARYGVHMAGENALPRFDRTAHQRIRQNAYLPHRPDLPPLESFTFLRMGETLFQADNWRVFVEFIKSMDDVYPEDLHKPWRSHTSRPSLMRPAMHH